MANGNPFLINPLGGQGAQIGQNLAGLGAVLGQQRQAEQQAQQQQQAQMAVQEAVASGDPQKVAQVMIQYPEYQKIAQDAFGFTNEQTQSIAEQTYAQVLANPENAQEILQQGIQQVQDAGGRPLQMSADLQRFMEDPESALKAVELGVASVAPEVHGAYVKQQEAARKAEQDTLKAQQDKAREGRAERELNIKEQRLDLDREKAETAKLANEARNETNDLKKRELELKIEGREQKIAENERKVLDSARKSISATERGLETANRLLEHPGLEAAVGTSSILPTRPGSDAADFEAELAAFDAQIFSQAVETMKGLGALSEAEGRKISAAAGALSPTMSEKAFKRSLTTIRDGMQAARDWLLENAPEGAVQPEAAQPTIDDLLSKYGN